MLLNLHSIIYEIQFSRLRSVLNLRRSDDGCEFAQHHLGGSPLIRRLARKLVSESLYDRSSIIRLRAYLEGKKNTLPKEGTSFAL